MSAHWPQILGIIIGMNIAFAGYVIGFLAGRPLRGRAAGTADTTLYFRIPGITILVAGLGYAVVSLIQIL